MSYKLKHTRQIVLMFITIPSFVLVMALVFIAIKQNMFEKRFHYFSTLENANGISTQTPVLYKGFEIGRVHNFELSPSGTIKLEFYILKRYKHIMVDSSVLYRTTNPITNRTTLEYIKNPEKGNPLPEGSNIPSTDFAEGRTLLRQYSPKSSDPIAAIIENIGILTSELNNDNNADKGALMRILVSVADASVKADQTLDLLNQNLAELSILTANLNRDNNPDAGVVLRIMNNVANISQSVAGQTKEIERLIKTANQAATNYADPDSLILKMIDPTGVKLIEPLSSSLYQLSGSLGELQLILGSLARSNPEMMLMINNLNDTLSKASKTLEAVNNNPILRGGITPSRIKTFAPESRIHEVPSKD